MHPRLDPAYLPRVDTFVGPTSYSPRRAGDSLQRGTSFSRSRGHQGTVPASHAKGAATDGLGRWVRRVEQGERRVAVLLQMMAGLKCKIADKFTLCGVHARCSHPPSSMQRQRQRRHRPRLLLTQARAGQDAQRILLFWPAHSPTGSPCRPARAWTVRP